MGKSTRCVATLFGACTWAVIAAVEASGQTLPPANASMGPPGTATMHANAASSNATTSPGPGSGSVSILNQNFHAVFPTILTGTDGLITADPLPGHLVSSTPYGSASGDNPLQMVSMISPSGVLYQGTERGLLRVEALVPEPATIATAFAALACGGFAIWRRRGD